MYDNIQVIRYMGNKNRLLDFIIPEIINITDPGDCICDLMAGTASVGYALKSRNRILSNDVQEYSYYISKALIENNDFVISSESGLQDLQKRYNENLYNKHYRFFANTYTDTYFSGEQCLQIDSIRYAIEFIENEYVKSLYLSALMGAMTKAQSSPGHFAQFMPKENDRIKQLRAMDVWQGFIEKCEDFANIVSNEYENKAYCLDYKELIRLPDIADVKCFYLDSPYSAEQYSRFYHILETVSKYDNPSVSYKAKYRDDRFFSKFCYTKSALDEFEEIISFAKSNGSCLVISYSNRGVVDIGDIVTVAEKYYEKLDLKSLEYDHSTQGKGNKQILEHLVILV